MVDARLADGSRLNAVIPPLSLNGPVLTIRKFKEDLANIDDLIGVLVLAKFPIVEKLHIDKLLPAIYAFCGYRAGKSN